MWNLRWVNEWRAFNRLKEASGMPARARTGRNGESPLK